jgi:release factor glutamine methyltransferase
MTGVTWRGLLRSAEITLRAPIDARRIVERASGYEGTDLVLHLDDRAPDRAVPFISSMVERRAGGEPLQYVIGRWAFRRLDLFVDRRVLIPRPETEVVVDVAVREVRATVRGRHPLVVDLGTGCGAIALSLALELGESEVWATDSSPEALAVARANLAGVGSFAAPRVRLVAGRWFDALAPQLRGSVDLVVSNPPYVAAGEVLPGEVADWEPRDALVSGPTGLEALSEILAAAPEWLARPGLVVLEVASTRAEEAAAIAEEAGLAEVEVRPDLAGRPRVLVGRV